MIYDFKGPYSYDKRTVGDWNSASIGVYYTGQRTSEGKLRVFYIGRGVGDVGIRGRLLQHLQENKWNDVTHFGYHLSDTQKEAMDWEASEIAKYRPKYNTQGL